MLAPERNREHSIGDQVVTLNVGFMERLQPAEASRVMNVLDEINGRWGKGTLRAASVPVSPDWEMRRKLMSKSYTTQLDQLWRVYCK